MLKKFSVKGFKQFKDLTLDFGRVRDYDFSNQCLTSDRQLVKTMLVYGPNASGKSNLGLAIFDIVQHLFDKVTQPESYSYYLNADSPDTPAEFSYEFAFKNFEVITYRYRKNDYKTLVAEELLVGDQLVFCWDAITGKEDFSNLSKFNFSTLNQQYHDRNISFLRYIANNSSLTDDSPVKVLMDFVGSMLWFRRVDDGNRFMGLLSKPEQIDQYIIECGLLEEFEKFLNDNDVNEKLVAKETPDGKQTIYFDHKRLIPFFATASSGTVALTILFYWKSFFEKASFVFNDEFDAFYHSDVAENVFKSLTLLDKQVMVTTHNTNLLDHFIVRPDVCFKILDGKILSLADRTNRALRQGNNLEKLYLAGEFDD